MDFLYLKKKDEFKCDLPDLEIEKVQKFRDQYLQLDLNQTFREDINSKINSMNSLDYQVKNLQKLLIINI